MERKITLPLTREVMATLRAGDALLLTGELYTARDAAHKRMCEAIAAGESLPFDICGATIYYAGPCPAKPGDVIGSCGPTTSGRMDAYAPTLLDLGQAAMIGKGQRSDAVIDAMVRNGAVYLCAIGGAGALIAQFTGFAADGSGSESVLFATVRGLKNMRAVSGEGERSTRYDN